MTRNQKLENRNTISGVLNAYGYSFSTFLGEESEMSYILTESANGDLNIVLTADCDFNDIFEDMPKPGYKSDWMSRGFNTVKFPINIISF